MRQIGPAALHVRAGTRTEDVRSEYQLLKLVVAASHLERVNAGGRKEPVESVELSRSRVRSGRSATRASPARYPRHDSNVHTLGLGQLPLPVGLRGPDGWGPGC